MVLLRGHKWDAEWILDVSNGSTERTAYTDLSVQAGCHRNNVSSLTVDGEHVGDGAVGALGEDAVAHHAVRCGGVVRVCGGNLHHRRACGEKDSKL